MMINVDKRVLGHFNNLLDHTKDKEKLTVNRQNIKYLVNKLEKNFILEHANERNKEKAQERALKIKRQTKEINRLHEKIEALEQQNKRYREALEMIADKREVDFGNSYTNKAYNHSRKIARKALEGESNE